MRFVMLVGLVVASLGAQAFAGAFPSLPFYSSLNASRASGGITSFSVPGGTQTKPAGINGSGEIVGSFITSAHLGQSFLRDAAGNITTFNAPNQEGTAAISINDSGTIAGLVGNEHGSFGFVRSPDDVFTVFDPTGNTEHGSIEGLLGINNSGAVVGQFSNGRIVEGFVRSANGTITIIAPQLSLTEPLAINNKGAVTGWFENEKFDQIGFIQTSSGKVTTFRVGSPTQILPMSINDSGAVAGLYYDKNAHAHGFVRSPGGAITKLKIAENELLVVSIFINNKGVVSGAYQDKTFHGHGFTMIPGSTATIFDTPDTPTVTGLNKNGRITGWYGDGDSATAGFVRKP